MHPEPHTLHSASEFSFSLDFTRRSQYRTDPPIQIGFENDSNLRAQIHCENIAKTRFARQFAVFYFFETFLKRVFSGVPFLYFTPICTATAKCRGSAKSRAFRPHRRVTARESTASEYELDRGDSMLIRFRFESQFVDSVRKRVSRANSSFLNIW